MGNEKTVAVVVVDAQRDFLDPVTSSLGSWRKAFCLPGVEQLLVIARKEQWRILHVGTRHLDEQTLPLHHRRRGLEVYCQADTAGCEFIVTPGPDEPALFKIWYSAFDADLECHLDGVDIIIWAGVATDCCIQQSAFDAERRGMESVIPIQSVSASTGTAFSASLVALGKSAATIVDLANVVSGDALLANTVQTEAIEQRSREWYAEQESRLGDTAGLALDEVRRRLGKQVDVAAPGRGGFPTT